MQLTLRGAVRLSTSLAIAGTLAVPFVSAHAGPAGLGGASSAPSVAAGANTTATFAATANRALRGSAARAEANSVASTTAAAAGIAVSAGAISGKATTDPKLNIKDPTDTGKCDGKMSGEYGPAKKCQTGHVAIWADPSSGIQVEACNGAPKSFPDQAPSQAYGYIYFDSTGKHTPGDYGSQAPTGGYIGANNNQSQKGKDAAPCDYQP
jgi:hypothetical protein